MDVTYEMVKVFDSFRIVGSGLWTLWGNTLRVMSRLRTSKGFFKLLANVVISILHDA